YTSMQLISTAGAPPGALAPAIADAAGAAGTATVVRHSLGAALATYLTLDLARGGLSGRVSACLFASPHTGNQAFIDLAIARSRIIACSTTSLISCREYRLSSAMCRCRGAR